jgi:hypothetical protein
MTVQDGDSKPVQFPAFRSYLRARETINDELMALVVAAGVASDATAESPQDTLLPEVAPSAPEVERLNQTVAHARALWSNAASAVARTAIPYVLSVYGVYLADAVGLLHGLDQDQDPHEPDDTYLHVLHKRIETATGTTLPAREIALFELIQLVRNRLAHQAGTPGSKLRSKWSQLDADAKQEWIRVAGRPILDAVLDADKPIDLQTGELNAVLAITHRLAHRVNAALAASVATDTWAEIVVQDYRELWPRRYGNQAERPRRLRGYAQHSYSPLHLTEHDLIEAARRVDVLYRD